MSNRHVTHVLAPAALVAVLASLSGCEGSEGKIDLPPRAASPAKDRSVEVALAEVERAHVALPVVATGTTEPVRAANLAPRISSRVQAVLVGEGEHVEKGTPLVRLDANSARLMAAQAAARAASSQAEANHVASELARLSPLAKRGTIPEQRVDQLQSQSEALTAAAAAARAAAQQARQDVAESTVRAPFSGRVSSVNVEAGEMAVSNPPTNLLRLVDLSEVEVRVPVHERELSRIGVGDTAEVEIPSAGRHVTAAVTYIRPEIDTRTRTAEVVVRFDNREHALLAGMFAQVRIEPTSERDALIAPRTAVGRAGDERFVYVVEQGHAHRRAVQVQAIDETRVELLSGVEGGVQIVSRDLARVSEGVAVRAPSRAASPPAAAAAEKRDEAVLANQQDAP